MYAVIRTGGKQYRVTEGDVFRVEKLTGEPGSQIVFEDILMLGGEKVAIGRPNVAGAKVTAEIVAQKRDKKVIVFKLLRRKRYRRKRGHRQSYTELRVTGVSA